MNESDIEKALTALPSPSDEEMEATRERILGRLKSDDGCAVPHHLSDLRFRRGSRWPRFAVLTAAAALILAVYIGIVLKQPAFAVVVDGPDAGESIEEGETVRTNGGTGTVLQLADGSTIEIRSKSELVLERADDGVRIQLGKGGIIVNAVKQRAGHLYVQTKHMTVAAVSTVFFVNAEEDGSRVAVIEGEVRVKQGTTEQKLLPGEQVATNPRMVRLQVKEEIAWSRKAEAHMALLDQARPQVSPAVEEAFEVAAKTARQSRGQSTKGTIPPAVPLSFEVASVKPFPPPIPTGGGPWTVGNGRFRAEDGWVRAVIAVAYGVLPAQVEGGPDWIDRDVYSFDARAEIATAGEGQIRAMLKTLLTDRFNLVIRRETKEAQVYTLVAGKKLQDANDGRNDYIYRPGPGQVTFTEMQNQLDLICMLSGMLGAPVLDETGLRGSNSFSLEFTDPRDPRPRQADSRPDLFTAIEKQPGLRLQATRRPVEFVVIDRIEKPSAN